MSRKCLDEPEGQRLFELSTVLSLIYGECYTAQVPPCIKLKQTAAKTILKAQHALQYTVGEVESNRNRPANNNLPSTTSN